MATMYDAIDPAGIPLHATLCAGYVDGHWPSYAGIVAAFPQAYVVAITVTGQPGVRVLDWENGNANPPRWCADEILAGRRPGLYCNVASREAVNTAIAPLRLGREVDWWAADWTGVPHVVLGSVATQWDSRASYDISETDGTWPISLPPPPPPGPPVSYPEDNMEVRQMTIQTDASGNGWATCPVDVNKVVGLVPIDLDPAQVNQYPKTPQLHGITSDGKIVIGEGGGAGNWGFRLWSVT